MRECVLCVTTSARRDTMLRGILVHVWQHARVACSCFNVLLCVEFVSSPACVLVHMAESHAQALCRLSRMCRVGQVKVGKAQVIRLEQEVEALRAEAESNKGQSGSELELDNLKKRVALQAQIHKLQVSTRNPLSNPLSP